MTTLTSHLSLAELACHDGTPYPTEWIEPRARRLAWCFEAIRVHASNHVGHECPIVIGSAYRTPAYNRTVGGARKSFHTLGLALDLYTPPLFTTRYGATALEEFWTTIYRLAADNIKDLRGLGRYPWGVHVDIRQSDRLVVFRGARPDAEVRPDEGES